MRKVIVRGIMIVNCLTNVAMVLALIATMTKQVYGLCIKFCGYTLESILPTYLKRYMY